MAEMNTEVRGQEHATSAVKQRSTSVSDILNYVEPEVAALLDKTGAKVHILRTELFSNLENFLNHLDIGNGDKAVVIISVHDASMLPAVTRSIMAKGALVRSYISYKLPASTFVLGIIKGLNF